MYTGRVHCFNDMLGYADRYYSGRQWQTVLYVTSLPVVLLFCAWPTHHLPSPPFLSPPLSAMSYTVGIKVTRGDSIILLYALPGAGVVIDGSVLDGSVNPTSDPVAIWRAHQAICLTLPPGPTPAAREAAAIAIADGRVPPLVAAVRGW